MVQDWEQRAALRLTEVAQLLGCSHDRVQALVDDHVFGDPQRLARTGRGRTAARLVPVTRLRAFVERGERGYPPGDDPSGATSTGKADDETVGASA